MKKIINGKKYDTKTAKLIGHVENWEPKTSLYYCEELYLKRTGEFFIYGIAISHWAKDGEDIKPVYKVYNILPIFQDEAKKWVEKYEKIFGEVEE